MRTVAVSGQPDQHIKVPLSTSTLGLLNRRFIRPAPSPTARSCDASSPPSPAAEDATAADTRAQSDDRAQLGGALLLADESRSPTLATPTSATCCAACRPALKVPDRVRRGAARASPATGIVDRWACARRRSRLSSGTGQPTVIEDLAGWARNGDLLGLFGEYLDVLFRVHVRLFARYGIALESHQQNIALVLGPPGDPVQIRLLVKDFDSTLIHLPARRGPRAGA